MARGPAGSAIKRIAVIAILSLLVCILCISTKTFAAQYAGKITVEVGKTEIVRLPGNNGTYMEQHHSGSPYWTFLRGGVCFSALIGTFVQNVCAREKKIYAVVKVGESCLFFTEYGKMVNR